MARNKQSFKLPRLFKNNTYNFLLFIGIMVAYIGYQKYTEYQAEKQAQGQVSPKQEQTQEPAPIPTSTVQEEKSPYDGMELPTIRKKDMILHHTGFTCRYNTTTNCPVWVAWELTKKEAEGTLKRGSEFYPDPDVPETNRITSNDYKGSGYDRGHMCPAADMGWSNDAMHDCFYMSNMCPQWHELNAGSWEKLERACRRWAKKEKGIYIVCGPIFDDNTIVHIGKEHQVRVPSGFFKCVLSLRKGHEKAIGFYFPHDKSDQNIADLCCSVNKIESMTGLDLFPALNDSIENALESTYSFKDWQ